MSVSNPKVDRRSLLLGAVFLVGGAVALTRFARNTVAAAGLGPVLSPDQLALLEQVADTMIPPTDSPGAIEAGVPAFVCQMLVDWGSKETHAAMLGVLERIEAQAWNRNGAGFVELSGELRLQLLTSYDADAMARQDLAYGQFKQLLLLGYYHSEVGATQELRYELVPGAWRSCLPLTEVGRASAV